MNEAQESSFDAEAVAAINAQPPGSKNFIRDFFGVIFDPLKTFPRIISANYWVAIFLVIVLAATGLEIIYHPVLVDQSIAEMMKSAQGQENSMAMEKGQDFLRGPIYRIMMPVVIGGIQALGILIWAALGYFLASVLFGGVAKFKSVWVVSCWAFVITLLQLIVKTPLLLATKNIEAGLNLGLIFTESMVGSKLNKVMAVFDLFGIWFFIVFGIGLAVAYKFSTKKGIGISCIIWLVFTAIGLVRALVS